MFFIFAHKYQRNILHPQYLLICFQKDFHRPQLYPHNINTQQTQQQFSSFIKRNGPSRFLSMGVELLHVNAK